MTEYSSFAALDVKRKHSVMRGKSLPDKAINLRQDIATANRILAHEGVLDAFGHVSARDPSDPNRYWLSRSRAPELVEPDDILAFNLDSEPVTPSNVRLYLERVIHGEIYKARTDVHAIVHHHAPAIMPYCITGADLLPVYHFGAMIGAKAPFWNSRDEFGDTNMLVVRPEEGRSLARALGQHSMVLMRRHGATVVGGGLKEIVFRAIYICRNAEFQTQARMVGTITTLTPGEAEKAETFHVQPSVMERAWEYWTMRLAKSEARRGQVRAGARIRKSAPGTAKGGRRMSRPARKAVNRKKTKGRSER
jgi:HCOMODA/2-hydroxy-3-carboxy-muconic semialdehyde decarboxylase